MLPIQNKNRFSFFFSCFILAALLYSGALVVSYADAEEQSVTTLSEDAKKAIEENEDRLDEIKAKIKAYKQIIDLKQRQGTVLTDQIESLEAQASKLELEIVDNSQKVTQLQGEIGTLEARIFEKERLIDSQRKLLQELLRDAYADTSGFAATLITGGHQNDILRYDEWKVQTSDYVRDTLIDVRSTKESLDREKTALLHKKVEADTLQEQLNQRSEYLESTKDSKTSLLAKTQTEVKKYDSLVDQLEREREEIEDEINALESDKVGELNLKDIPSYKKGLLAYPVKNTVVSQGYGKTSFAKSSKYYKNNFHNGIDYSLPSGSDVLAAADGKVVALGNNGKYAYGKWMAVDHGNGIVTMYGHLSAYKQSRGDKVERGEVIAKSGNTGYSTGPHLHFTVFSTKSFEVVASQRVSSVKDIPVGATVNPKNYLP